MGINQRGVDVAHYRRIRELREDHDLTQRQLANYLNMPQPQYFRYEQGYRDIPTDILIALVHTAVASGHGCGAQRPLCGLTATPI
ncbi:helix-turn-helix domain-containing protein [Pseudoflavonifractor sp. P01025]|uniref:helix-turn-helix domain-containing protein n=1 Tax=Flintibacter porci TaxID=3342383 RepID=UPI0035B641DA